jgi:molybdenum cofactor cytidylyltransferase
MISAIVLAAGLSTRMGGENKLLLPFRGGTLLSATVATVTRSRVRETIVVVGHEQERVRQALTGLPVRFVSNPAYRDGMLTSIQAGVRALAPTARGMMICLSDLPSLKPDDLNRLVAAFVAASEGLPGAPGNGAIVVPTYGGRRGNPVLFDIRYRPEVLALRGLDGGAKAVVQAHPGAVVEVPLVGDHVLQDIDTPEDYRRLLESRT